MKLSEIKSFQDLKFRPFESYGPHYKGQTFLLETGKMVTLEKLLPYSEGAWGCWLVQAPDKVLPGYLTNNTPVVEITKE